MVYSSNFVLTVVVGGHIQKEKANGVVEIPFGSEYTLRLRNKNDRRAVVKISIDGENVSGGGYVIPAKQVIEIKRHWDKDCAFKFVDLDSEEAHDAGKNGPNPDKQKGVVEAKFHLEKKVVNPVEVHHYHHHYDQQWSDLWPWFGHGPYGPPYKPMIPTSKGVMRSTNPEVTCSAQPDAEVRTSGFNMNQGGFMSFAPTQDGCTVEGELTGQQFSTTFVDYESEFVVCKLFLQGYHVSQSDVGSIGTTDAKTYCTNCGAKRPAKKQRFCGNCGSRLS